MPTRLYHRCNTHWLSLLIHMFPLKHRKAVKRKKKRSRFELALLDVKAPSMHENKFEVAISIDVNRILITV